MTNEMAKATSPDVVDRGLSRAGCLIEGARQNRAAGKDDAGRDDVDAAICVLVACTEALGTADACGDELSLSDLYRLDGQIKEAGRRLESASQHCAAGDRETAERKLDEAIQLQDDVKKALEASGPSTPGSGLLRPGRMVPGRSANALTDEFGQVP